MKKYILHSIGAAITASAMGPAFSACSANDLPEYGKTADGTDPYFSVNIVMPQTDGSRSEEDDDIENTEDYDRGVAAEYAINNLHLYFFKKNSASGKYEVVKFGDDKFKEVPVGTATTYNVADEEYPGGEDHTTTSYAVQYKSTTPQQITSGEYIVCALCNDVTTFSTQTFTTLDEFLDITHTVSPRYVKTGTDDVFKGFTTYGIPMSSRSWNGTVYQTVSVTSSNTYSNPAKITLYVERELARVRYCNTTTSFTMYDKDNTSTSLGTVVLQYKELLNNPAKWYTFRHVGKIEGSADSYTATYKENDLSRFGTVSESSGRPFVLTPSSATQNSAGYFADNDSPMLVNTAMSYWYYNKGYRSFLDWVNWDDNAGLKAATYSSTPSTIGYIPENVMAVDAQRRGNATCLMFKAELRPTKAIAFIKYDTGSTSTKVTSTIGYNTELPYNPYWSNSSTAYENTYTDYPDLYYYKGKFYANLTGVIFAYKDSDFANVTDVASYEKNSTTATPSNCQSKYGIKRFVNHYGYYFYYIKHADNGNNTEMGRMEYAIVRNNSYDIRINKVYAPAYSDDDLTNPDIDPTEPIEEEEKPEPENTEAYIEATLIVRPWICRPQTTDLGKK